MAKGSDKNLKNGITSAILQSPLYPVNYVRVLIQIGHEPLPPFKSKNLFGRDQLFYPNSFSYLRYIYSVEGFTGLYRGLGMKIISNAVGSIAFAKLSELAEENNDEDKNKELESSFQMFFKQTNKEITLRCCSVIISHPFHVMAIRCMAQFVGGETNYSSWNVFQNASEIFRGEGILGFFSGLIPRLLFEASTIAIANTIAYLIKTYVFEDKEIDTLIDLLSSLVANSVTYPLSLVSTVSSLTGSALVAAKPPRMASYTSWMEVFKHLYENNELKRGSSSFYRVYTPQLRHLSPISYVGF